MPSRSEARLGISDYAGYSLFRAFSPKKLAWLVSALLCEESLVFVCSQVRKLSSVVYESCVVDDGFRMSFVSLIYPLEYVSTLIPVLPDKMHSIMDAPVPFVIGITNPDKLNNRNINEEIILVRLDDPHDCHHITTNNHSIPDLPFQKPLCVKIF